MSLEGLLSHVMGRPARVVLAHDEPPLPDQPVYHHRPLGPADYHGDQVDDIRPPRQPDPVVFGVPLERHEVYAVDVAWPMTTCYPCGVKWAGDAPACWCCGRTAARLVNPLNEI
jgi:hypothetical protein